MLYQAHSDTSRLAAEEIEPRAGTLRRAVLDFVREQGPAGATDEEMQLGLSMNPSTQRPRRVELVGAGLLVDSGRRRLTASRRQAAVWIDIKFIERQQRLF